MGDGRRLFAPAARSQDMKALHTMRQMGHEQVVLLQDAASGLRGIIAVHDTTLGPALGGIRMQPYASEDEALADVLNLSRGMTYKAAAAGLDLGGGKAVIIGDPRRDKSDALFRAFGRFVQRMNGLYYAAEDVGVTVADIETVALETRYVVGVSSGRGGGGDPSPVTALGVFEGMRASAQERWGSPSLEGRRVAVQGLGKVGLALAARLRRAGAVVTACDVDEARARQAAADLGIAVVHPDEIYDTPADIFAPCALGGAISELTLPRLHVEIIAGSANNQLRDPAAGDAVHRAGILYAPDYVINAGGLINVYVELGGYDRGRALDLTRGIADRLREVFEIARRENVPTYVAADRLAGKRLTAAWSGGPASGHEPVHRAAEESASEPARAGIS
jgi:leucine dehydrogenase